MAPISRLAFIGNSLPRRCGIATFTTDLQQAIASRSPARSAIVAMNDQGRAYEYPQVVQFQIDAEEPLGARERDLVAPTRLVERERGGRQLIS